MMIMKNNTRVRFRNTSDRLELGVIVGTGTVSLHEGRITDLVYLVQTPTNIVVVFDSCIVRAEGYERDCDCRHNGCVHQWRFPME